MFILITCTDGPEKVQKQGRDERMIEDYPTFTVHFLQMSVVFLHSSPLPCFCTFSGPSLIEMKFTKTFPP